ncbi:hypothetical protein [Methanosarcina siciliae]|uniref:hypothetical protein n=1 Tax=Methanosarcina siciliae TaxID=38027 RepID=UPI000AD55F58|nr:hypothetical protein [Methanosarcina siciliae]
MMKKTELRKLEEKNELRKLEEKKEIQKKLTIIKQLLSLFLPDSRDYIKKKQLVQ